MSKLLTKSDATKGALIMLVVALLCWWLQMQLFAVSFAITAVILWLWRQHLVNRDRRLARRTPVETVRPVAAVPPKASPASSNLELPDFD